TLFEQAGISWKKTQKRNPKADPELVEKKTGDYGMVRSSSASDRFWGIGGLV
ncbi:winged helix-turn-helix domain-containing protein, partial [Coleofasciculus sp. FACHB-SPT36]|nr:winged helix-turn-helix domain-containing protein [Coleofasciculus sp. FACHB-SPT36]